MSVNWLPNELLQSNTSMMTALLRSTVVTVLPSGVNSELICHCDVAGI